MKIENLDTAVRYKERRENLLKVKSLIERNPTSVVVELHENRHDGAKSEKVQDDCLTGIIHKYCEDTLALIDKAIEQL